MESFKKAKDVLRIGKEASKEMVSNNPYLTTIGASLIVLDIVRGGILYQLGTIDSYNYTRNRIIKTRPWGIRFRTLGAITLGFLFYPYYQNEKLWRSYRNE